MKVSKMLKQAKRLGERQAKLTAKKTPNRVNKALIDVPVKAKKLTDIANYNCNKGQSGVNTVRAVQKRRLGCRELV
ncbi:hypothetical protein QWT90_11710 [Pasteurella multocida]|uniref:hypothetical protein n=1 Tax=Pasteurella multocida TaxID=747 RepID=UPI0029BF4F6A|nr:hypothetical protein [Pasteurella multocida]MDX3962852.1 hypothetical protein [Pasteurella multocida]